MLLQRQVHKLISKKGITHHSLAVVMKLQRNDVTGCSYAEHGLNDALTVYCIFEWNHTSSAGVQNVPSAQRNARKFT
jgi:hypothetical protein